MSGTISIPGEKPREGLWCVLRTSGPRTLSLARSLSDAGYEAWTPSAITSRRRPRSNAKVESEAPILPTFVFAKASHLTDLLATASSPTCPHPAFSVFRYGGKFPLIADVEVDGLRREERRARIKKLRTERHDFGIGEPVRVPTGSFAGMSGVIEYCNGKFAAVAFGGNMRVKIATFLLESDAIEQTVSIPGGIPEHAA